MRTVRAAAVMILTALAACDNVRWGGAEVRIVKPPPTAAPGTAAPEPGEAPSVGLPRGTVIFHVMRGESQDRLVPVAEVSGDSLRSVARPAGVSPQAFEQRFRAAVLEPNSQYVLFRRGAAVGTFTLQGPGPLTTCGVPTGVGQATTVAAAAADREFIAFRRGLEPRVIGEFSPPQVAGPILRYAPLVAERLILTSGLQRPGSWTRAQRDLQALDLAPGGSPEMATTFLSGDELAVGAPNAEGWSVFYVAAYEQRTGYNPIYSEVRDYRRGAKAAPKLIDHLNWNGQGGSEMLVQVYGARDAWYEAVSSDRGGRWQKVWEGKPCRE